MVSHKILETTQNPNFPFLIWACLGLDSSTRLFALIVCLVSFVTDIFWGTNMKPDGIQVPKIYMYLLILT